MMFDLIGYAASAFLAVSLMVTGAFKFRTINMVGQVTFIIYGVVIHAFPIIIANAVLLLINIYQLYKLLQSKEQFKYVPIQLSDKIIDNFLKLFPEFSLFANLAATNKFCGVARCCYCQYFYRNY